MRINGVELHVDPPVGGGELVILVHGGWTDATTWAAAIAPLARTHRVVAYDRCGHTRSERGPQPPTRRQHEDDLAALIDTLDLGPAHLVGTSGGAVIALALAGRRPELVRSVVAHEPPVLELEPLPAMEELFRSIRDQLAGGDIEAGTRRFFEDVALGPGGWELIPEPLRRASMNNAQTFIDLCDAPDWLGLDVATVSRFERPLTVARGDDRPAWLPRVTAAVAERLGVSVRVIAGAGHSPQITHPELFAALVAEVTGAAALA
jgi:pimeloyl-ACP methyl ester carboxylesterase